MGDPARASATVPRAVNGGQIATSTPRGRFKPSRTACASSLATARLPCIFQLATTNGVRISSLSPAVHLGIGSVGEGGDPGERAPLEELEERPARGGNVADLLGH